MTQKEFTDFIIPKMIDKFPQFAQLCTSKSDDITDIDNKSNKGKLTFSVTTQDKEITLGFTGDTDCDWHTHMSLFEANTPDEELEAANKFISDIIFDKKKIIHSSIHGYYPTDKNVTSDKSEIVEIFKWSDL